MLFSEKPSMHKKCQFRSYSGQHFPAFGLSTERYRVSLRIQSECGKMRTRITPNTDTLHAMTKMLIFSKHKHAIHNHLLFTPLQGNNYDYDNLIMYHPAERQSKKTLKNNNHMEGAWKETNKILEGEWLLVLKRRSSESEKTWNYLLQHLTE